MDEIWTKVIKTTGYVGVVSFLIYTLLQNIFSPVIIEMFGSERMFTITFVIATALIFVLLVAILVSKSKSDGAPQSKINKVVYKNKSKHDGDNNF
jgi:hypothetical protein